MSSVKDKPAALWASWKQIDDWKYKSAQKDNTQPYLAHNGVPR